MEENLEQPQTENTQEKPPQNQGMPITPHINAEFSQQLQSMGFSRIVSQKSLFLTQNASLQSAIEWIENHTQDPDFQQQLFIVGQQQSSSAPKLSKQQAQKKARELQQELKKRREQADKQLQLQQEKDRMRQAKQLMIAKREMEEHQRKRAIQQQMREKRIEKQEKKRMQQILRRDKEQRFGKSYKAEEEKKKPVEEKVAHAIKTIKTLHPNYRHPGVARTCLNTLRIYTNNAMNNPEEQKFQRINKDNKAFQDRVAKVTGGVLYLKAVGFEQETDCYQLVAFDRSALEKGLKQLEEALSTLESQLVKGF